MKLYKTNVRGNPNVGLYAFCTDLYCLLSADFTDRQITEIKKVLKVPVYQLRISNTFLIGALLAGNSKMLLVPHITFDEERKLLDNIGMPYTVIPTELTALGNNILCNDNGAYINHCFDMKVQEIIGKALDVPVKAGLIADTEVCGSCGVHNSKGLVLHAFASNAQIDAVQKLLNISITSGTVNFGSPYVRSGVFANKNGMVIGDTSTALEIENIYEALGFLKHHD